MIPKFVRIASLWTPSWTWLIRAEPLFNTVDTIDADPVRRSTIRKTARIALKFSKRTPTTGLEKRLPKLSLSVFRIGLLYAKVSSIMATSRLGAAIGKATLRRSTVSRSDNVVWCAECARARAASTSPLDNSIDT